MDLVENLELVEAGAAPSPVTEPATVSSWEAECNCPDACNRDHEQD